MRFRFGFFIITAVIVLVDQVTKFWAFESLKPVIMIEVIPGLFRLTYATNRGVAFSLFADSEMNVRLIFAAISTIAALVVIGYLVFTPAEKVLTRFSLSLLLAGIIGNLIDRVRLGEVIDFLDFHIGDSYTWPTFNIADSAICIGAVLLALEMIREERSASSRKRIVNPATDEGRIGSSES